MKVSVVFLAIIIASTISLPSPSPFDAFDLVEEGSCGHMEPMNLDKLNIEWALRFTVKAGYVPLASKMHYYLLAKTVLDRPPTISDDFTKMCPVVHSGIFENILSGFGKRVEMECEILGIGFVSCFPKNDPKKTNSTLVISWTDNSNYILTLNCLPGNFKTWNIMSTHKNVDPTAMDQILNHIETHGFDKNKALSLDYEGCKV